jgi:hypothetical protein
MCQQSLSTDAGPLVDGPLETSNDGGDCDGDCSPHVCVVGSANCDTSTPDCEARISDAPPCFPTYLGTTVVMADGLSIGALAVGDDGAIYLGGSFFGSADFDPGPGTDIRTAVGDRNGFVTKLNPDGSRAWTVTFAATSAGTNGASVNSMFLSPTSLTLAGGYGGTVDFDPGPAAAQHTTGNGGFILSLTLDGVFRWVSTLDSGSSCTPVQVAGDANGDFYVAGWYSGVCDFDPGPGVEQRGPLPNLQAFIVKVSSQGALLWAHSYEGSDCVSALNAVAVTRDGNAWVTGLNTGTCYLDGDIGRLIPGSGALVAALDPGGGPLFTWNLGHDTVATGQAVVAGADGSVYLGGRIFDTVDFDPGPGRVIGSPSTSFRAAPRTDRTNAGFVLNLTSTGTFRSVQTMAGIDVTALSTLADNGVLVMGYPRASDGTGGGVFLTEFYADSTPGWSLYSCGPDCGGMALAAGRSTFVVFGVNNGNEADLDPGPAVDLLPSAQGLPFGVAFLSRYAF